MNSDNSQPIKITLFIVFGAYFIWWSQKVLELMQK